MILDVMIYNGDKATWLIRTPDPLLQERSRRVPEWILFRYGHQTYYRTFENHIYLVKKVKKR